MGLPVSLELGDKRASALRTQWARLVCKEVLLTQAKGCFLFSDGGLTDHIKKVIPVEFKYQYKESTRF